MSFITSSSLLRPACRAVLAAQVSGACELLNLSFMLWKSILIYCDTLIPGTFQDSVREMGVSEHNYTLQQEAGRAETAGLLANELTPELEAA